MGEPSEKARRLIFLLRFAETPEDRSRHTSDLAKYVRDLEAVVAAAREVGDEELTQGEFMGALERLANKLAALDAGDGGGG